MKHMLERLQKLAEIGDTDAAVELELWFRRGAVIRPYAKPSLTRVPTRSDLEHDVLAWIGSDPLQRMGLHWHFNQGGGFGAGRGVLHAGLCSSVHRGRTIHPRLLALHLLYGRFCGTCKRILRARLRQNAPQSTEQK